MDNAGYFEQMKSTIEAFPSAKTRTPAMPLRELAKLADYAASLAQKHQVNLVKAKFDYSKVNTLIALNGGFRHISSAWQDVKFDKPETSQLWKEKQAEAEMVFFELVEALKLVYFNDENMLEKIRAILEGGSIADSIQDLNDIVYLVNQNPQKLYDETELTPEIVAKAAVLATELGQIYANAKIDSSSSSEELMLRNKAYTMVEDLIDEIERRGRYAYRNEQRTAVLFSFTYHPIKRKKKEEKPAAVVVS